MHEALYYETKNGLAVCRLCPKNCRIAPGKAGYCRTRRNREGRLYAVNYGRVTAVHLDPVEKKPLFHFYPGHRVLSFGSFGCNLACAFCQNWAISQEEAPSDLLPPEELVAAAVAARERDPGCVGVAFTYNEPGLWFEYILDAAPLLRRAGFRVVMVTNGFLAAEPLADLLGVVDAFNVDVKAFAEDFYTRVCRGLLRPVLETVEAIRRAGRHLEVTHLVVTGENDDEGQFAELVEWLAGLGPEIPLHLSRYHPAYRLTNPATPFATLERFRGLARRRLHHVYVGNTWRPGDDDTACAACGAPLIVRRGFYVEEVRLARGRCSRCGTPVHGVGMEEAVVSGPRGRSGRPGKGGGGA